MSKDRIDTPEHEFLDNPDVSTTEKPSITLNANAKEFQPLLSQAKAQLRPTAPEFVPSKKIPFTSSAGTIYSDVSRLVTSFGVCGIRVADIPGCYLDTYGSELDLSSCSSSDLSVLLQEIPRLSVLEESSVPASLEEALVAAGFEGGDNDKSPLVMGCEETFQRRVHRAVEDNDPDSCPLGADRDKVAVDGQLAQFVNELKTFKDSIVDVIAKSSAACPAGIPLSAFETEWEKSFVAKGLVGMPDFNSLTSRFHVKDVVRFLKCIPCLEVSGSDFVIVRLRESMIPKSKSIVMLDQELFGQKESQSSVVKEPVSILATVKQHISSSLVTQLQAQVDKQVLELGSHLAKNGLQTSPQDLVLIRLQLQQLQTLKAALQAVVSPVVSSSKEGSSMDSKQTYAALLSQAAQYAMSAISASKRPGNSGVSTAVSSKRSSPVASAQQDLSREDVRGLLLRLIEKGSLPVSSVNDEWKRMYPSLPPIESLISNFGFSELKQFLIEKEWTGKVVVYYATLPSPQLRVASRDEFTRISKEQPVAVVDSAKSPLLSPTSTCSYTSDLVVESRAEQQQQIRVNVQKLTELIFRQVRAKQVALIKEKANQGQAVWKELDDILRIIHESNILKQQSSRLDSRRPPPIDTSDGGSGGPSISQLMKTFIKKVSELIQTGSPNSYSVSVSRIQIDSLSVQDVQRLVQTTPGIRLVGTDRCTLTALSSPGALVASVFACNDASIWASANEELLAAVRRFVEPPNQQLTELSATLFKSIMAGGSRTAKDCASALKVLAAKDPKSIHEIVSNHIGSLKKCDSKDKREEAAKAFVNSLMEKGKRLASSSSQQPPLDQLLSQFESVTNSAHIFKKVARVYSRDDLVRIRAAMDQQGLLEEPPCATALRVIKMTTRR